MERSWLRRLAEVLPRSSTQAPIGIGDDGAVVRTDRETVVVSDMILEGVHFRLEECGGELVGRKAAAVNLSDLAAMGAWPTAAFLSLALPRDDAADIAEQVMQGARKACEEFDAVLAGGDTNVWHGPLAVSVTMIGRLMGNVWRRGGARPGDRLAVTGPLGGSIAGRHLSFTPRLRAARTLMATGGVTAAIDLSDGLSLDAARMIEASGCGAVLIAEQIPQHPSAVALGEQDARRTPLERALHDGEDFELLLAVAPDSWRPLEAALRDDPDNAARLIAIGYCDASQGLRLEQGGQIAPLPARGYEHGAAGPPSIDASAESYTLSLVDESATRRLAVWLAQALPDSAVVSLNGELGAGKTFLVRELASAWGVAPDEVFSPTFVLVRTLRGERMLHHLDAYRVADDDEFWELGVDELFQDRAATIIEWGGRFESLLPEDRLDIELQWVAPSQRRAILRPRGAFRWATRQRPPDST